MKEKIIKELIIWIGAILIIVSLLIENGGGLLAVFFYSLTILSYYFLIPILKYGGIELK